MENTNLKSVVPALGSYKCEAYQNNYRKLLVTLDDNLLKDQAYTLQLYIQNPGFITSNKGFTLYLMKKDANTIIETFTKT